MSSIWRRLDKIEQGLTPKQVFLHHLDETHQLESFRAWMRTIFSDSSTGSGEQRKKVEAAARAGVDPALRGKQREQAIREATSRALLDSVFLSVLHVYVHEILAEQEARLKLHGALIASHIRGIRTLRAIQVDAYKLCCLLSTAAYPLDVAFTHAIEAAERLLDPWVEGTEGHWPIEIASMLHRLSQCRVLTLPHATELYAMRGMVDLLSQRYFDGHPALFREDAAGLEKCIAQLEWMVELYNREAADCAPECSKPVHLSIDPSEEETLHDFTIDLNDVKQAAEPVSRKMLNDLVITAKALALRWNGDDDAARALLRPYWEEIPSE